MNKNYEWFETGKSYCWELHQNFLDENGKSQDVKILELIRINGHSFSILRGTSMRTVFADSVDEAKLKVIDDIDDNVITKLDDALSSIFSESTMLNDGITGEDIARIASLHMQGKLKWRYNDINNTYTFEYNSQLNNLILATVKCEIHDYGWIVSKVTFHKGIKDTTGYADETYVTENIIQMLQKTAMHLAKIGAIESVGDICD